MEASAQSRKEQAGDFESPGPTLTFSNISYAVNLKKTFSIKKGEEKWILQNVSGIMKPGMNALLGPTGSGKTSLLDVLAHRKNPKGIKSGQVQLNGQFVDSSSHQPSAYVVQDDILMGTLSVRENLEFSANLRLSKKEYNAEERQKKVNEVIQELGLQDCASTKIGTEFLRGISGGERKRCSIGMELITSPSLLFLDEPTTGLDANTANSIMHLLYMLSRNSRTIIFSIHQPRYSIFRLFDSLTLMNKGQIIYQGPGAEALDYFTEIGFKCEPYNNPSDFFLDVINGAVTSSLETPNSAPAITTYVTVDSSSDKNHLVHRYEQSRYYDKVKKELKQFYKPRNSMSKVKTKSYPTSFWNQLYIVGGRTMKNFLRNPQTSVVQVFMMIFFGILNGLIFFQIPNTMPEALQNRIGAFFFLIINQVFGNLSAVELFIKEKVLFIHENSSGYYRTSAYFLSKILIDLIPNRIIPIFGLAAISYFMIGLKEDVTSFFLFILTISLTSLAAVSLAFFVSASANTFAAANALIAIPYVLMMVFGGFLVNLNGMLNWLSWLKWISIFRYGLDALAINELKGQIFYSNLTLFYGEAYLDQQGINHSTWGFWQNEVALFCMTIVFMFLAFVQLLTVNKWK
uniref:ATP-binding cassette sub-family G member 2-like protein n=1 Tax=Callorhinchus milii TaxID=7868 RepID=V9KJK1_CALMI|eukprot:gi/632936808/ref/XP_007896192.1/ PREDICTED: ATP-binding cassette sub-family G member 2-like [Callorhinchus milii]